MIRGWGKYTFVGSNGCSVVDYVITSQNMLQHVASFQIGKPNILSDHSAIDFSFEFDKPVRESDFSEDGYESVKGKYIWKDEWKDQYVERLSADDSRQKINTYKYVV